MSYIRVAVSGRRYHVVQVWECETCLARLDDDEAIGVHEAWHSLAGTAETKFKLDGGPFGLLWPGNDDLGETPGGSAVKAGPRPDL